VLIRARSLRNWLHSQDRVRDTSWHISRYRVQVGLCKVVIGMPFHHSIIPS
jgi:hypothetical protein